LAEQGTLNPKVGGSIPPRPTPSSKPSRAVSRARGEMSAAAEISPTRGRLKGHPRPDTSVNEGSVNGCTCRATRDACRMLAIANRFPLGKRPGSTRLRAVCLCAHTVAAAPATAPRLYGVLTYRSSGADTTFRCGRAGAGFTRGVPTLRGPGRPRGQRRKARPLLKVPPRRGRAAYPNGGSALTR
jgi:hypothetical protein